ncbi:hypothetical protein SK128_009317 [Halocaridina rubra]|uniref:Uncharacterized protein n=1 Tax=Halocaridina rubra TaxID=373956 RepID=A0AAN8WBM7_HALRR
MLTAVVAGVIGILLAGVAGQLGSIFHIAVSATNAFAAPFCSLFLAGMCTPWVNEKGAYAGVLTSLAFSLWLLIGKIAKGLGSPKSLPVSTDGCPENLLLEMNSTFRTFPNSSEHFQESTSSYFTMEEENITTSNINDIVKNEQTEDAFTVYNLSYCYAGMLGVIIGVFINCIVSLATGPLAPEDVDPRLVSPLCLRMHKFLWRKRRPKETRRQQQEQEQQEQQQQQHELQHWSLDVESTVPMMFRKVAKVGKEEEEFVNGI